jgi:hypothetical protein
VSRPSKLLGAWFVELRERLNQPERITASELAECFAGLLGAHVPMTHLLAILPSILEQNVAFESIVAFKVQLQTELDRTGPLLEKAFLVLRPGDGAHLLMQLNALAIGLFQVSTPPLAVQSVFAEHPTLSQIHPNPALILKQHITCLLAGWPALYQ